MWIVVICGSFLWNYVGALKEQERLAFSTAASFFQQIVITRKWNAEHGGLYAQVTETTQPNPYLQTKNRDLQFNSSLILTQINPAFMTRQISEIAKKYQGIQFHITSLNPIRPDNKATELEAEYLHQFELTAFGKGEFVDDQTGGSYFFMAPLITEKSCLKCHAKQGYKEGDIRGGISVTLPFKSETPLFIMLMSHFLIGLVGLLGLAFFGKNLNASYNKIKTQATIDTLTGLPNRQLFQDRLSRALLHSKRLDVRFALFFIDLDKFKIVNDTLGHAAGDQLLIEVSERIQKVVRESDTVARLGGDEFTVMLNSISKNDDVIRVAQLIVETLSEPFFLKGKEANIGASIGIAVFPDDGVEQTTLMNNADSAMYQAKQSGRNQYCFFE